MWAFGVCYGPVAHYLGLLARTLSRWEEAAAHLEAAAAATAKAGARPLLARTQYAHASTLRARGSAGDRERADELLAAALRTARELGMDRLVAQVEAQQSATPRPARRAAAQVTAESAAAVFRREGDFWTIAYAGAVARLKDSKGLQYLAHLLRHPGHRFPALELASLSTEAVGVARAGQRSRDPLLDAPARAAYRGRLDELRSELEEAERMHDLGRTARLREELEQVEAELAAGVGLGGRARANRSANERARWAVTKRIKSAIDRVRAAHPALGRHLATTITTGYVCAYLPDPQQLVDWLL